MSAGVQPCHRPAEAGSERASHPTTPSPARARRSPCPAARSYTRASWLLPRALSPLIPVFLLATVYWGLGSKLDAAHVTSIAGAAAGVGEPAGRCWGGPTQAAAAPRGLPTFSHPFSCRAAVLFMSVTSSAYGSMGLVPTLVQERAVYLVRRGAKSVGRRRAASCWLASWVCLGGLQGCRRQPGRLLTSCLIPTHLQRERADGLYAPHTYLVRPGRPGWRGAGLAPSPGGRPASPASSLQTGCPPTEPFALLPPHHSPSPPIRPTPPPTAPPQLFKVLEEFGVPLAVSAPYCLAVWYAVSLQGSFLLYWLAYLVTTAVALGARRGRAGLPAVVAGPRGRLVEGCAGRQAQLIARPPARAALMSMPW